MLIINETGVRIRGVSTISVTISCFLSPSPCDLFDPVHFSPRKLNAAIDGDGAAGDVLIVGIAQERHTPTDFLRSAKPTERKLGGLAGKRLLAKELSFAGCVSPAGVNDVAAYSELSQFDRGCASHLVVRRLGHVVRHRAGHRHVRVRTADHDDVAARAGIDQLLGSASDKVRTLPTC